MDEFNVINKADNLEDLEKDMNDWTQLPFNFRMRANDHCMEVNGCTVPDYYNKQKIHLSNNQAMNESVIEDIINDPNFEERKRQSAVFDDTPFIVIIDPDVSSIDELNQLYDSFLLLSPRCRTLSNEYSYAIWGYNVMNMYSIVSSKFDNFQMEGADLDLLNNTIEDNVEIMEDFVRSAFVNNKTFDILSYRRSDICKGLYEKHLVREAVDGIVFGLEYTNAINLYLPKVTPYFTAKEIREAKYNLNIDTSKHYGVQLFKAIGEEALLEAGWNPALEVNDYTIDIARGRQNHYFKYLFRESNVTDVRIPDNVNLNVKTDLKPVFMIFSKVDDTAALSFDLRLDIAYEFVGYNTTFSGFKKVYKDDMKLDKSYQDIDVILFFLNPEVFNEVKNKVETYVDQKAEPYNSVYTVLLNARNKFDPLHKKVLYANCVDHLIELISKEGNYTVNEEYGSTIYKVFEGQYIDYDPEKTRSIIAVISDKNNIINTLEYSYYLNYRDACNEAESPFSILANSLIVKKED